MGISAADATTPLSNLSMILDRLLDIRRFLDMVEKNVPAEHDVHVVLDNASTHKPS